MDTKMLFELVTKLIGEKNFHEAEEVLVEARERAVANGDISIMQYILSELVDVYCLMDPPRWEKAEELSIERELWAASAYSKLQSAMILYHGIHDYVRAIPKLQEAIAQGQNTGDPKTTYMSFSLLGQAYLQLGHTEKALAVLGELEKMVAQKESFVVGDETCFLENLLVRQLESERVARLASILASVCRDTAFKKRLLALTAAIR